MIESELYSVGLRFRFIGRYFKAVKASILDRKEKILATMNDEIVVTNEVKYYF